MERGGLKVRVNPHSPKKQPHSRANKEELSKESSKNQEVDQLQPRKKKLKLDEILNMGEKRVFDAQRSTSAKARMD